MINKSNSKTSKFITPNAESLISKRRVFNKDFSKLAIVRRIEASPIAEYNLNILDLKKRPQIKSRYLQNSKDPYSTAVLPGIKTSSHRNSPSPPSLMSESFVYNTDNSKVLVRKYNGDFSSISIRKNRDENTCQSRISNLRRSTDIVNAVSKVEIVSKTNNQLKVTVDMPYNYSSDGNSVRNEVQTPKGTFITYKDVATNYSYMKNGSPDMLMKMQAESSESVGTKGKSCTTMNSRNFNIEMDSMKDNLSKNSDETPPFDIKENVRHKKVFSPEIIIRHICLNDKKKYLVL